MDDKYFQGQVQQRDFIRNSFCASQLLFPRSLIIDFTDKSKFTCPLTEVFFFTILTFLLFYQNNNIGSGS